MRGAVAPLVPSFLRTGLRVPQDEREGTLALSEKGE
jgi:hypothetical protein